MAQINVAPNGNYTHRMTADVTSFDVGNSRALVHCRYWVDRHTSAANGSWYYDGKLFRGTLNGTNHDDIVGYDWRSYATKTFIEFDQWVPMSAYKVVSFGLYFQGQSTSFSAASGSGNLGIPWVPQAPTPIGLDQVMPTSMRYRFSGNSNNGSSIDQWQAQISTNSSFSGATTVTSSGTTTFGSLNPATRYYFRSRGHNGVGWGPWSSTVTEMTASGAYVSQGGSWVPVPVYVSDGSDWEVPELQISNGTVWEDAL